MSSRSNNIDTVKEIYDAFGRNDIPAFLSKLAEDVEWEYGIGETNVPWYQLRQGRDAVGSGFFSALQDVDFSLFQPKTYFENENIVIVLMDVQWTHKGTGKYVDNEDAINIWHFNSEGKVAKFGHRGDTHRHWLAIPGNVAETSPMGQPSDEKGEGS